MRTGLSRFTEWHWSEGRLRDADDIARLAPEFFHWLSTQHRRSGPPATDGLHHIVVDMARTLRVLRYGGRTPSDVPAARKSLLTIEASRWGWQH